MLLLVEYYFNLGEDVSALSFAFAGYYLNVFGNYTYSTHGFFILRFALFFLNLDLCWFLLMLV